MFESSYDELNYRLCWLALQRKINTLPCPQMNHWFVSPGSYNWLWTGAVQRWNGALPWDTGSSPSALPGVTGRFWHAARWLHGGDLTKRLTHWMSSCCNDFHGPFSRLEALIWAFDSVLSGPTVSGELAYYASSLESCSHLAHCEPVNLLIVTRAHMAVAGESAFCAGNI